ncbi:MAG: TasA family protein [Parcubacteria group bacterium]|jgi:predicted ribosomally synthesized peptide with SipW-like signal peptide
MKKITKSLLMITAAAAIVIGGTSAFFSSQKAAVNNTFKAGTLNLQLAKDNHGVPTGGWQDVSIDANWNFPDMAPGETPQEATMWLKNNGSIDAKKLGFSITNANDDNTGFERQVRITKMTFDGQNMLQGGAGADQSVYVKPTHCDINVNPGAYSTINAALESLGSATGKVICVGPGNYTTSYETNAIIINQGVTLVSTDGPGATTISASSTTAGVTINAVNVTIKGFTIAPDKTFVGYGAAIAVNYGGAKIQDNVITDVKGDGQGTIKGIHAFTGSAYSNLEITNNVIKNIANTGKGADGIMIQGKISTINITHNTITDISSNNTNNTWDYAAGIEDTPTSNLADSSPLGLTITYNHIENVTSVTELGRGFTVDIVNCNDSVKGTNNYAYADQVTFKKNDIIGIANPITNKDQRTTSNGTLNAEDNWFGDFTPVANLGGVAKCETGVVNTTNFAGGPFAGFVGGTDQNSNGFADMQDLRLTPIAGMPVAFAHSAEKRFVMGVQVDGPTTLDNFQGASLHNVDLTVTMLQQ